MSPGAHASLMVALLIGLVALITLYAVGRAKLDERRAERPTLACAPLVPESLRTRHAETADRLVRVIAQHHMVLVHGAWPDFDGPVTCECGAFLSTVADADVHMARMIQRADVSQPPSAPLPE